MTPLIYLAVVIVALAFFSAISFKKKALDVAGIIIANVVGLVIFYLGGLNYFFLAVLFFVVAEASTRFSAKRTKISHERRTTGNIFGNSCVAVIALAMNVHIAFFGALAAALADTLSSEFGMLSKKKPVLLTTFKEVEPGTDGGVTALGTWSSLLGAAIIASIHFAWNGNAFLFGVLVLAGAFGSMVDSFFGAVFERHKILGNTEVNFLGSGAGALLAFLLSTLL